MCTGQRQSGKWKRAEFFFCSGERFMPPPQDFRSIKRTWLGSGQNQAKMSGGLDKTDYERLNHLVSENNPPMAP